MVFKTVSIIFRVLLQEVRPCQQGVDPLWHLTEKHVSKLGVQCESTRFRFQELRHGIYSANGTPRLALVSVFLAVECCNFFFTV